MTRPERVLLHGATAAVSVSGLAYAAFKLLVTGDDPFSAVNHPLQPWALRLHVLAAPVLVFGVGMIFRDHVLAKVRNGGSPAGPSRRSGLATMALLLPLAASGYLLQVIASGATRDAVAWIHLGVGAAFTVGYGAHAAASAWRALRRPPAREAGPATAAAPGPLRLDRASSRRPR